MRKYETIDFHGLFRGQDLEDKTNEVMKIYKLIFRFSIDKLSNYLKDDSFLIIIMQYLKDTQLQRFHQRNVLQKNLGAYYRSIENMINFSEK